MKKLIIAAAIAAAYNLSLGIPASAQVGQDAIDGCIDQIRAVGGPDGQSGTVLSSEFSEANSLIMFEDAGGTVWRCLVSNDGVVADLVVAEAADDGGGAMAGATEYLRVRHRTRLFPGRRIRHGAHWLAAPAGKPSLRARRE